MGGNFKISKKGLVKLYLKNKKSTYHISKIYKCNPETIRRKLISYKINRRYREIKIKIPLNELRDLYLKQRISTLQLAKKYHCSQWTIYSNMLKAGIKLRKSTDFLKWKPPANQIKPLISPSQDLSYILGVLLGDGWLYKYKHNYFIGLDTIEYPFSKSFHESLKKINLNPNLFKKGIKYWRAIASSKLFYEWFNNLTFDQICKMVEDYPKDFLRGIYESEGCLSINHDKRSSKKYLILIIVSCEKETIDLTKFLIESLGLHPRLNLRKPKPPRKPIWVLNLGKQGEIKAFLKVVKPQIKNKTQAL